MQTVVVIGDERDEELKRMVRSFVSINRYFIYIPLAECYSEIGMSTIETADIVLVATNSINSAKQPLKGEPLAKFDKTVYIYSRKGLLTTWNQKKPFKHVMVCKQDELYRSIQGLLEILAKKDIIDLGAIDILSFCTDEVTELYYWEAERELVEQELANISRFWGKYKWDIMVYVNGDVTLSDVDDIVHLLGTKENNIIIGVGYSGGTTVVKVCLLARRC